MAFTYLGTLATDRDKVRFHLQDTVSGSGPKPADGNFTDAEIDGLLDAYGSWRRAVAGGFDTLATAWRRYPTFKADGLSLNRSDIAKGFADAARDWRRKYGLGVSSVGTRPVTRVDGYSDDVDSHET